LAFFSKKNPRLIVSVFMVSRMKRRDDDDGDVGSDKKAVGFG
jgi:hypothetical protein